MVIKQRGVIRFKITDKSSPTRPLSGWCQRALRNRAVARNNYFVSLEINGDSPCVCVAKRSASSEIFPPR